MTELGKIMFITEKEHTHDQMESNILEIMLIQIRKDLEFILNLVESNMKVIEKLVKCMEREHLLEKVV